MHKSNHFLTKISSISEVVKASTSSHKKENQPSWVCSVRYKWTWLMTGAHLVWWKVLLPQSWIQQIVFRKWQLWLFLSLPPAYSAKISTDKKKRFANWLFFKKGITYPWTWRFECGNRTFNLKKETLSSFPLGIKKWKKTKCGYLENERARWINQYVQNYKSEIGRA